MNGADSLENSNNFSQLPFSEKLGETEIEDIRHPDVWKESHGVNIEINKMENSLGNHNETESVKSRKSNLGDDDRLSGKSVASNNEFQEELEEVQKQSSDFEALEKMQVENSASKQRVNSLSRDNEDKDDDNNGEHEEEIQYTKETNVFEEEVIEIEPKEITLLLTPETSPRIQEIEKFRADLRELGNDGKFKVSNKELSIDEKKERYKEIVYAFNSEEDAACLICLDAEAFTNDDLFLCDLCNSAVHQSCFGSELIDITADDEQGEWFCHRCSYLLAFDLPFTEIRCDFCPEMKGAIKKIREKSDKNWGHVNCVNWIPEIYYEDGIEKQNVFIQQYWKSKSAGRKQLTCDFCKIKYGDCIKCDGDKCNFSFHVICGQIYGLIACWKDMQGLKRENDEEYYLPIYCKSHMRAYRQDMYNFSNKIERKNQIQLSCISYFYYPEPASTSTPQKKSTSKQRRDVDKFPESAKPNRRKRNIESPLDVEIEQKRSLTTPRRSKIKIESESGSGKQESTKRTSTRRKTIVKQEEDKEPEIATNTRESDLGKDKTPVKESAPKEENKRALRSRNSASKETSASKQIHLDQPQEPRAADKSPSMKQTNSKKTSNQEINENRIDIPELFVVRAKKRGTFVDSTVTRPESLVTKPEPVVARPAKKSVAKEEISTVIANQELKRVDQNENKSDASSLGDNRSPEEENMQKLYKLKPTLASVIKFYEWTTEKEIKQEIQKYITQKGLYNKAKREVVIRRDAELEKVIGIPTIPRDDIFKKFLPFMYEKKPEIMTIRDDEDLPFQTLYDIEYKKMKDAKLLDSLELPEKITTAPNIIEATPPTTATASKITETPTKEQKQPPVVKTTPKQPVKPKEGNSPISTTTAATTPKATQQPLSLAKKDSTTLRETTNHSLLTKKSVEETKHQESASSSLNSKREGSSLFDLLHKGEDTYPSKKVKPNSTYRSSETTNDTSSFLDSIFKSSSENKPEPHPYKDKTEGLEVLTTLIKADQLPFRKNMSWFSKCDDIFNEASINSNEILKILWPKGAEVLF